MKYTVLTFSQDSKYLQKFLQLPKRLYHRTERMQKPVEELEILKGTHILSHYFQVCPLLVLDKKERPILVFLKVKITKPPLHCSFPKQKTWQKNTTVQKLSVRLTLLFGFAIV